MNIPQILFWTRIFFIYISLVILSSAIFLLYYVFYQLNIEGMSRSLFLIPAIINLTLTGAFIAPFFLKRSQGAWKYNVALLYFSLLGCYAYPFNIVLLIKWNKQEFKNGFVEGSNKVD